MKSNDSSTISKYAKLTNSQNETLIYFKSSTLNLADDLSNASQSSYINYLMRLHKFRNWESLKALKVPSMSLIHVKAIDTCITFGCLIG